MTAPFRLGLIGAGRMGQTHLRALAGSAAPVVAIAEPSPTIRAELAAPNLAIHASIDAMLDAGGLDGLLVAAPSTHHLAILRRLVPANLPVLCEKPCGISAAEAQDAAHLNLKLQVAYWRRFVPDLQRIHARIAAGELGKILYLACHQWDGAPPTDDFRANSGGIFVDMGVHEFDQIRWLTGQEFSRLTVVTATGPSGHVEAAHALCELSAGTTALVSLGQRYPEGDVCYAEIFGTRSAETSRFLWPPTADKDFHHALRQQAEAFAAWSRGAPQQGATAADAIAALRAAEQAMQQEK